MYVCNLTRNHIPKAYSGHGDEAKVEWLKKRPLFIISEKVASHAEKNG